MIFDLEFVDCHPLFLLARSMTMYAVMQMAKGPQIRIISVDKYTVH